MRKMGLDEEEEKKAQRASRFGDMMTPEPENNMRSGSRGDYYAQEDVDEMETIVGTCTNLEKAYLRLTERPSPSSVRPVEILKQSLELMRKKKREGASWNNYLGEQLKSIRQDLVIQAVADEFALEVYETNARWCLEYGDIAEFKRCLLRIEEFYNHLDISSPNVDEFYCYSLLYNLVSEDFPSLNAELVSLTKDRRAHPAIKQAVSLCEAYLNNNWHQFFKLARTPHFLSKHLLDVVAERLRINALKTILISYVLPLICNSPPLSLKA